MRGVLFCNCGRAFKNAGKLKRHIGQWHDWDESVEHYLDEFRSPVRLSTHKYLNRR